MGNDERAARQAEADAQKIEQIQARIFAGLNDISGYDATDDFSRSIDECYREIRERVAAGKGWTPPR